MGPLSCCFRGSQVADSGGPVGERDSAHDSSRLRARGGEAGPGPGAAREKLLRWEHPSVSVPQAPAGNRGGPRAAGGRPPHDGSDRSSIEILPPGLVPDAQDTLQQQQQQQRRRTTDRINELIAHLDSFAEPGSQGATGGQVGMPRGLSHTSFAQARVLTPSDLLDRGYTQYTAEGLTSAFSSKPAAILTLETAAAKKEDFRAAKMSHPGINVDLDSVNGLHDDSGSTGPSGGPGGARGPLHALTEPPTHSGRGSAGLDKQRYKLIPRFINSACRTHFHINDLQDYSEVMRMLLKRDPLLSFSLQKAIRQLKAGHCTAVTHVTPDQNGLISLQSTALGIRMTPCLWSDRGQLITGLLIEHQVPHNTKDIITRLLRDYAVLSHVPGIVTLVDFTGRVLYQNAASLSYAGDLVSASEEGLHYENFLKILFLHDMPSLQKMIQDVTENKEWQGVVQVPQSVRRHLAQRQRSALNEPLEDLNNSFTSRVNPVAGVVADELEMDIQIGNSFSAKSREKQHMLTGQQPRSGQASFLVHRHPNLSRNLSLRVQDLQSGAIQQLGSGRNTFMGGGAIAGPGPSGLHEEDHADIIRGHHQDERYASATSSSNAPAAASMIDSAHPQRKFMTYINKPSTAPRASNEPSSDQFNPAEEDPDMDGAGPSDMPMVLHEEHECYHEVHAIPLLDPVLDSTVVMLVQTDVTARVELENKLADLTDAQLNMLEQLFPRHIIEYMLSRSPSKIGKNLRDLANTHEQVMALFCDVVDFTAMSKEVEPNQVMHFLNELYEVFDDLVDEYNMYKLDTVGDCYIVVAGLIKEDQDGFACVNDTDEEQVMQHAGRILAFAKAMLRESKSVLMPHNSEPVQLRIGIHTGPLVSGLVGAKMPKFTLFGDTMNTASRMESTCKPGHIHVSENFAKLLANENWESTGGVQVKGKGQMQTYFWVPRDERQLTESELGSAKSIRRNLSRNNSFMSTRSRATVRSLSSHRRHINPAATPESVSDEGNDPLLAILANIRGENDGHEGDPNRSLPNMLGSASTASKRPKSARWVNRESRRSAQGEHMDSKPGSEGIPSEPKSPLRDRSDHQLHRHGSLLGS